MDIFYICDVESEGTSFFHGDLYELRKSFYDAKGKKVSVKKKITETGADGRLSASISHRGFKWKKKIGRTVTEQNYRQSNGTVLVRRDFNGSIICKIFFDEELAWFRTEYYSPDSFVQAKVILRPANIGNIIERLTFVEKTKYYEQEDLTPIKLDIEDFENYYDIDNSVIIATPEGDFVYKPNANVYEYEPQKQKDSNGNTVLIMNAWEIKGGSVPHDAKHHEPTLSFKTLEEIGDENNENKAEENSDKFEPEIKVKEEINSSEDKKEEPKADTPTEPENKPDSEKSEDKTSETTENIADNKSDTAESSEPKTGDATSKEEAKEISSENKEEVKVKTEIIKKNGETSENTEIAENVKKLQISNGKFSYSGEYADGKREGIGRTENANGFTLYNGEYHEDKRNGVGASFYSDGKLSFAGNWKDDKKNGVGVSFRPSDGSVHIANWDNGSVSDNITLVDGNGNLLYSGNMTDGKKNGVGISKNKETGYTYIGEFVDGKSNGIGSLFDENGRLIYNGSWSDGMKNGQGTEFDAAGNIVYSGEWLDNEYHNGILYQKI